MVRANDVTAAPVEPADVPRRDTRIDGRQQEDDVGVRRRVQRDAGDAGDGGDAAGDEQPVGDDRHLGVQRGFQVGEFEGFDAVDFWASLSSTTIGSSMSGRPIRTRVVMSSRANAISHDVGQ